MQRQKTARVADPCLTPCVASPAQLAGLAFFPENDMPRIARKFRETFQGCLTYECLQELTVLSARNKAKGGFRAEPLPLNQVAAYILGMNPDTLIDNGGYLL